MKNEAIRAALQDLSPDEETARRVKNAVLSRPAAKTKTAPVKILAPLAACLAVALLVLCLPQFSTESERTDSGEKLVFYRGSQALSDKSLAFAPVTRALTAEESEALFASLPVQEATGAFDEKTGAIRWAQAVYGETEIFLGVPGDLPLDTVIVGEEKTSQINGTAVTAGRLLTERNSRGERNVIYYASFEKDGAACYLECGGAQAQGDTLRRQITDAVDALTKAALPSLASLTY